MTTTNELKQALQSLLDCISETRGPDAAEAVANARSLLEGRSEAHGEPSKATGDHDFPVDLVERVSKACTRMGIATSPSIEECSFKLESLLYSLCRTIENWNDKVTSQACSADHINDAIEKVEACSAEQVGERDQFEEAIRKRWFNIALGRLQQTPDMYASSHVQTAWELWKDRAALTAPAPERKMTDAAKRIAAAMANVMFNLAQQAGHTIDSDDCALFDKLRKQWDAARNQQGEQSGWVSVKDRLPERETQKVIVWCHMFYAPSYMHVGVYKGGKWEFDDTRLGEVSHWMPLPAAPTAQKDAT